MTSLIIETRETSYEVFIYLSQKTTFSVPLSASRLTYLIIQPWFFPCWLSILWWFSIRVFCPCWLSILWWFSIRVFCPCWLSILWWFSIRVFCPCWFSVFLIKCLVYNFRIHCRVYYCSVPPSNLLFIIPSLFLSTFSSFVPNITFPSDLYEHNSNNWILNLI